MQQDLKYAYLIQMLNLKWMWMSMLVELIVAEVVLMVTELVVYKDLKVLNDYKLE